MADLLFDWIELDKTSKIVVNLIQNKKGKSPGLLVMGGDSRSKGCGFESLRHILDGHDIFSH